MTKRTNETTRLTPGQKITTSGFNGTVIRLYSDGEVEGARMYEVRLPGGVACICGSDIMPAAPTVWNGQTARQRVGGTFGS